MAERKLTRRLRIAEWLVRWVLPVTSFGTLVTGAFVTKNFTALATANPGLATFYGFAGNNISPTFFTLAFATTVLAGIQNFVRRSIKVLEQSEAELREKLTLVTTNLRVVFDALMLDVVTALPENENEPQAVRASLYLHDGEGHFLLCGRYSPNPNLRLGGRASYSDDQGCISRGWQERWFYDGELGDTVRRYNRKATGDYNIPRRILDKITMRSRMMAVHRVEDGATPVGVLVVESLTPDHFENYDLEQIMRRAAAVNGPIMNAFRDHIPDPRVASEIGF